MIGNMNSVKEFANEAGPGPNPRCLNETKRSVFIKSDIGQGQRTNVSSVASRGKSQHITNTYRLATVYAPISESIEENPSHISDTHSEH